MPKNHLLIFALAVFLSACATDGGNQNPLADESIPALETELLYEEMFKGDRPDITALKLFFTNMPKGGDLHHHFTGSIYVETYLDWVAKKGWLIDSCDLKIVNSQQNNQCEAFTVEELLRTENAPYYRKLLSLWSDKDYENHFHDQPPPDSKFFSTFGYFGPVSNEYMRAGLKILKERAVAENVSYIETMLTRVGIDSSNYFSTDTAKNLNRSLRSARSPGELYRQLDNISLGLQAQATFNSKIDKFVKKVATIHQGIDDNEFTMRYQAYASRTSDPLQVFTDLYSSYLAVEKTPLLVGVNIVGPENNHIALSDYTLHMHMFRYLQERYPNVNTSLHAGELTLGMVRPKDLLFHVRQALEIAEAKRIGHGVDLPYEENSVDLLAKLKSNAVIEINLTSNEFILDVMNNEHPYLIYSRYGVPLVISTDDSGVSRDNLTNAYVMLSTRYHPSYRKIKEYVYNSINYAFLSPNEKSANIKLLDIKFEEFEKKMAGLMNQLAYANY